MSSSACFLRYACSGYLLSDLSETPVALAVEAGGPTMSKHEKGTEEIQADGCRAMLILACFPAAVFGTMALISAAKGQKASFDIEPGLCVVIGALVFFILLAQTGSK